MRSVGWAKARLGAEPTILVGMARIEWWAKPSYASDGFAHPTSAVAHSDGGSDRPDIGEALLGQRHAGPHMARLANVAVQCKHGLCAGLFGPADDPAER